MSNTRKVLVSENGKKLKEVDPNIKKIKIVTYMRPEELNNIIDGQLIKSKKNVEKTITKNKKSKSK